nr:MAG TPA: hypothetical protein [Caudoviricetes sp.]
MGAAWVRLDVSGMRFPLAAPDSGASVTGCISVPVGGG